MFRIFSAFLLMSLLGGCAGVAIGAASTVVTTASEERGISVAIDDLKIQTVINEKLLSANFDMFSSIKLRVREGRVLMIGAALNEKMIAEAVRITWEVPGVKEVYNEVAVTESQGLLDYSRDALIAAKLQTEMSFNEKIYAINFTVDVFNGSVYLLGIARTQKELDRVINLARNLSYVRRIVNHVRILDQANGGKY